MARTAINQMDDARSGSDGCDVQFDSLVVTSDADQFDAAVLRVCRKPRRSRRVADGKPNIFADDMPAEHVFRRHIRNAHTVIDNQQDRLGNRIDYGSVDIISGCGRSAYVQRFGAGKERVN